LKFYVFIFCVIDCMENLSIFCIFQLIENVHKIFASKCSLYAMYLNDSNISKATTLNGNDMNHLMSSTTRLYHRTYFHKSSKEDLDTVQEFYRFLSINLTCILSIILVMTGCYLSHVFYKIWKPFWR